MLRRPGVLVSLFVALAPTVGVAEVTLNGGSLTAEAYAGEGPDWDRPASLVPQLGTTTLRAEASGTVPGDYWSPDAPVPVSAWTTIGSVIDSSGSGGMSIDLTQESRASLAFYGAGSYSGAGANSSVSVSFSVDTPTMASLEWLWNEDTPLDPEGLLVSVDDNQRLFDSRQERPSSDPFHGPYGLFEYLLQPGQYRVVLEGSDGGQIYSTPAYNIGSLSLNLTPVPLPASMWLLSAGLAGIGALRKRRTSPRR